MKNFIIYTLTAVLVGVPLMWWSGAGDKAEWAIVIAYNIGLILSPLLPKSKPKKQESFEPPIYYPLLNDYQDMWRAMNRYTFFRGEDFVKRPDEHITIADYGKLRKLFLEWKRFNGVQVEYGIEIEGGEFVVNKTEEGKD